MSINVILNVSNSAGEIKEIYLSVIASCVDYLNIFCSIRIKNLILTAVKCKIIRDYFLWYFVLQSNYARSKIRARFPRHFSSSLATTINFSPSFFRLFTSLCPSVTRLSLAVRHFAR